MCVCVGGWTWFSLTCITFILFMHRDNNNVPGSCYTALDKGANHSDDK